MEGTQRKTDCRAYLTEVYVHHEVTSDLGDIFEIFQIFECEENQDQQSQCIPKFSTNCSVPQKALNALYATSRDDPILKIFIDRIIFNS